MMVKTQKRAIDKLSEEDVIYCSKLLKITSIISFVLLCILVVSPVVGLFIPTHTYRSIYTLFEVKSNIVRAIGLLGLAISIFALAPKVFLYGFKSVIYGLIKNPWNILFVFILIWGAFSFTATTDFETSMLGYRTTHEGYLGYLSYAGIYMMATSVVKEKRRNLLFNIFVITSVVISALTLLNDDTNIGFILDRDGMCVPFSGTYINSNHFGYYLCVACAICLTYFMQQKSIKKSALYFGAFILNLICLSLSNTFGSYLAVLIMMIFVSVIFIIKNPKSHITYAKIFIIWSIAIPVSAGFNRDLVFNQVPDFFSDIAKVIASIGKAIETGDVDSTIRSVEVSRIAIWVDAIKLIANNPVFGVGPDMALYAYRNVYGYSMVPHNEYLQAGVCMGAPAGIAFFVGVIIIIVRTLKNVKVLPETILVSALAMGTYAVSAFFGITLPIASFLFWMMMGLTNAWYQSNIDSKLI